MQLGLPARMTVIKIDRKGPRRKLHYRKGSANSHMLAPRQGDTSGVNHQHPPFNCCKQLVGMTKADNISSNRFPFKH